jgi:ubiquinone/menaquinone biosynthesis C-methylase UbiE
MDTLMQQSEYENIYYSEDKMWWYIGLRDILLFYIKKFSKKDSIILDAGCGTGKNIEFLESNGLKVHGIDISNDAIKFCNKKNLFNVKCSDIAYIPYSSDFFDIVYSMDVIGNLDEQNMEKAIKEFIRVLKKNGILIINTAAFEWLRSQHDDIVNLKKRFTKSEIKLLFSHQGVKILKLSYRVFLLFFPIAIIKWFKRFIKIFTKKSYTDLKTPPTIINIFLMKIQLMENRIIRKINFPFGSSLFLVLKKNEI